MKQQMYKKSDFSKGQKVYLLIREHSNAARDIQDTTDPENWILEATVSSVGVKYITVALNSYSTVKFDMTNNWLQYVTCGSINYILFKSKRDLLDAQEAEALYREVRENFSGRDCPFSLKQMKAIYDIIGCR